MIWSYLSHKIIQEDISLNLFIFPTLPALVLLIPILDSTKHWMYRSDVRLFRLRQVQRCVHELRHALPDNAKWNVRVFGWLQNKLPASSYGQWFTLINNNQLFLRSVIYPDEKFPAPSYGQWFTLIRDYQLFLRFSDLPW